MHIGGEQRSPNLFRCPTDTNRQRGAPGTERRSGQQHRIAGRLREIQQESCCIRGKLHWQCARFHRLLKPTPAKSQTAFSLACSREALSTSGGSESFPPKISIVNPPANSCAGIHFARLFPQQRGVPMSINPGSVSISIPAPLIIQLNFFQGGFLKVNLIDVCQLQQIKENIRQF